MTRSSFRCSSHPAERPTRWPRAEARGHRPTVRPGRLRNGGDRRVPPSRKESSPRRCKGHGPHVEREEGRRYVGQHHGGGPRHDRDPTPRVIAAARQRRLGRVLPCARRSGVRVRLPADRERSRRGRSHPGDLRAGAGAHRPLGGRRARLRAVPADDHAESLPQRTGARSAPARHGRGPRTRRAAADRRRSGTCRAPEPAARGSAAGERRATRKPAHRARPARGGGTELRRDRRGRRHERERRRPGDLPGPPSPAPRTADGSSRPRTHA